MITHLNLSYIQELYDRYAQEEGKDVNIAAELPVTPTMIPEYAHSKRAFARSAFGEKLVFGTSGIRDYVKFLQDIEPGAANEPGYF